LLGEPERNGMAAPLQRSGSKKGAQKKERYEPHTYLFLTGIRRGVAPGKEKLRARDGAVASSTNQGGER